MRRYGVIFLGCPIDLALVDRRRLENHLSGEYDLPDDTNNKESEDDDYYYFDDGPFTFVKNYVDKKYGSLFYLGRAPDLDRCKTGYGIYLAIHLPEEYWSIPELTRFFTNFDPSVLDQFRNLMKFLGQPEEKSEPGLCSCHGT